MENNSYLHEVAITAIVVKDGKYLIVQRSTAKKRFPNLWTVPGGRLEVTDYTSWPKDTKNYWYNVLEKALRREVKEETGIEIDNINYLTSLATVHTDNSRKADISNFIRYGKAKGKKSEWYRHGNSAPLKKAL